MQVPGFEIVGQVGKGGMGEVFHAVRVGPGGFRKPAALKRLALDHTIDGKMVQRFLAEARITARLEHPNVVRVHDLLVVENEYFIVMELLRGHNLATVRAALPEIPWWLPFAIAEQALRGLEYAHALESEDGRPLGLVHRDLTPRNLFVCEGGVVKILDFGIAKLRHALTPAITRDGSLQGTLEFLAPEQARGEEADARTDLFQLGGSIYWTLTGEYPHGGGTPAEIVARALHGSRRPLRELRGDVPEAAAQVIERAMAPRREDRYPDAAAMRAAVEAVLRDADPGPRAIAEAVSRLAVTDEPRLGQAPSQPASPSTNSAREALAPTVDVSSSNREQSRDATVRTPRRRLALGIAAVGVALAIAGVARWREPAPVRATPVAATVARDDGPRYRRATFRRGIISAARFAPDGKSFVYSAAWGGDASDTYLATSDNPEGQSLNRPGTELLSISRDGKMALLSGVTLNHGFVRTGALAIASLSGGAERPVHTGVQWAEFAPDGSLMVVRWQGETSRLESPLGTRRFESDTEWVENPRFSPDGKTIAFLRHPLRRDSKGAVAILDGEGRVRDLTPMFSGVLGLLWRADGREIWFGAVGESATDVQLHAATLDGAHRVLARVPGKIVPSDVSPDGRALVRLENREMLVSAKTREARERDLSWFDYTWVADLSRDGKMALLCDSGGTSGEEFGVYSRAVDGGGAVRLGTGIAQALSPDGKWALALARGYQSLVAIPTGPGEPVELARGTYHGMDWLPDGRTVLYCIGEPAGPRCQRASVEGGAPELVTLSGYDRMAWFRISPDGKTLAAQRASDQRIYLVPLDGGEPRLVKGALAGERPVEWSADGSSLLVARFGGATLPVFRINLKSGRRETWKEIVPADPSGVTAVQTLAVTPDERVFAYSFARSLSTLYLVDGLR